MESREPHWDMKRVDMDSLVVVHSGETWAHATPPCSRAMIRFLERNEDVVTWVQVDPVSDSGLLLGSEPDQFPVIRMNGQFFSMSLRMMKAVW
jgi:hypothetical protein